MAIDFRGGLGALSYEIKGRSRAINAENPTGEKGKGGMSAGPLGPSRKGSPCIKDIKSGESIVLADIEGSGVISHIWMTVTDKTSDAECFVLRDLILRIYWDDCEYPSVESPIGDLFCCGFGQACQINSLPIVVAPNRGFNIYFQMPYKKRAKITLENQHSNNIPAFFYQIDYMELDETPVDILYFHANWRRQKLTVPKEDYVIVDEINGKGHYVGTYIALTTLERYWWGEGEVKFFIDGDKEFPTICGTGMEDYFGGSWSFAKEVNGRTVEQTYSTPFLGYPFYADKDDTVFNQYHNNDCMPMRGLYRFHVMDPICFQKDLKVTIQQIGVGHRGLFERSDDLSSVAYWYQTLPHAKFPALLPKEERWPR